EGTAVAYGGQYGYRACWNRSRSRRGGTNDPRTNRAARGCPRGAGPWRWIGRTIPFKEVGDAMKRAWYRVHRYLRVVLVCHLGCGVVVAAIKKPEPKPTPPDVALTAYISRVEAESAAEAHTPGAIWTPDGRLTRLSADVKASRLHDPIAIVVSESLAASTDGTVKNSRASNASSQISALFGKLSAGNALNNLLNQT